MAIRKDFTASLANGSSVTLSSSGSGGGSGGATDSLDLVFNNANASAYKIVVLNANTQTILASSKNLNHINKVLGIRDSSGNTVSFGIITNNNWNWEPETTLYLGDSGDITTVSAVDGSLFSLSIGYAVANNKVLVRVGTPIVL